ncbi:MAG: CotH kinase family protein [Vicinamibacterales bacterium]
MSLRTMTVVSTAFAACFAATVFTQTPAPAPAPAVPSASGAAPAAPQTPPPPPGRGAAPAWAAQTAVEIKATARFDKDRNGWLNVEERKTARQTLAQEAAARGPSGLPAPRAGGEPTRPGPRMSPADVRSFPDRPAFDPDVVRTFFLEFEDADWEKALTEFRFTDIDLPARLTVDGRVFNNVGIHYRGASSFLFIAEGRKRSLNIALDFVNAGQQFGGYRTFNMLNGNGDPTLLKGFLYYHVAREYLPAAKVNFAKVVINGEYWGVYVNTQQEDRDFVNEWWKTTGGTRWKAPGSPWGKAGFNYIGEDVNEYKKLYEIKGKDEPKAWAALIKLCKVLTETPLNQLETALAPIFDVDGALRFLALESAFINDDGYWIRASDYNLYLDDKGRFHVFPHDGNEAFYDPPANIRGKAARGPDLDPFIGAEDPNKVLLSRLVAVPALRARYLGYLKDIATKWLDWNRLGPIALKYQTLIAPDVQMDTRKLESYTAFQTLIERDLETPGARGPVRMMSVKTFADQRREFLLNYPDIKKLP